MFQLLAILIGLGSIIWAFFSPVWAWLPVLIEIGLLLLVLFGVKKREVIPQDALSWEANEMLKKYSHFYAMPFAARDLSTSATIVVFTVVAIAIIGAFQGFWLGIVPAVFFFGIMGHIAKAFNPTVFITDPTERLANQEVIEWVTSKNIEAAKAQMKNSENDEE